MDRKFRKIGFVLLDGFALMSCASAIEPLRAANLLAETPLFDTVYLSQDGGVRRASCGAGFDTVALDHLREKPDVIFVVAGGDPFAPVSRTLLAGLRALAAQGVAMGGISGGSVLLAKAGLLQNRRFTVHWEHFEALQALSDDYLMERRLYVIDRDRYTCAGGAAPLDMMHAIIRSQHGAALAHAVSDWFIHTGVRRAEDPQRGPQRQQALHRAVETALALMENHLADPLSVPQIARLSGSSERQLHRHFAADLGQTPKQVYLHMRLRKSDDLLRQTRLPLTEVALACGFATAAHFSTAYKKLHKMSPKSRREQAKSPPVS
ncbi:GlxA family transcriptional regulator [Cognatishimia sp. SS12]|uniref:GlxA family transcriptional regulator n=1 Tax=Cognatishimia sp. SS12 TaxID=2979465 RepID=UPI00232ECA91|nr:GlxA family transcriptional regulator [Cognatishimia sp. SS12]MDC0739532.1 GlxA family transcriptional regulator [Cognatishimia sp. SS12]